MPRAGLTAAKIIAEAATVADEVGLDRLTLAAVAERCGVSLPGLYKHVDGMEQVRRGIALLGVRELTAALARAAVGVTGRQALHAMSAAYRDYALAHPGRYAASVTAPAPDDGELIAAATDALAVVSAAFTDYHLEGENLIHAVRMVRAACHGFATLQAAGGYGLPESVDLSFGYLIDSLDAAFRRLGKQQDDDGPAGLD